VKFSEGPRATEGHGSFPPTLDAELRKYGHRSVFDTLVVHTVNDGCWFGPARTQLTQSTSPGKQPQGRGPNEIGGSLLKRWSMWFNSTIHGAPYPPQCRPSSARTRPRGTAGQRRCMAVVSSCCEAWPWVAKRTPPTPPPPPPSPSLAGVRGPAEGRAGSAPRREPRGRPLVAEVKSIWPTSAGPHTCYKGRLNGLRGRKPEPPPNAGPSPDCAVQAAHEVETVSNRASGCHGEAESSSAHTAHHARKVCPLGSPHGPRRGPCRGDRWAGDLSEVDTR